MEQSAALSGDLPLVSPADDAFGYASFAKHLASAVLAMSSPQGVVLAIDGPWGAGKTTLLNFTKAYLQEGASADTAVVVDFNPWWFSDRNELAMQFLSQLRARFPSENKTLLKAGEKLAEYAEAVGKVVDAGIVASTGFKIPLMHTVITIGLRSLKKKAKDVPGLKAEVAAALAASGKRFVVFVDDIDRLTPDEVRETFKVIKAIADFPNVVYVLAFDRAVVAESLQSVLRIRDGNAYLGKIVQGAFSLPALSRTALIGKLSTDLDRVMGDLSEGQPPFDSRHWANVLHDGVAPLITKPRDVVRVVNAIAATFPAVRGEVNPVDFIALEALRTFVPRAYEVVRDGKERFSGLARERDNRQLARAFHDDWLDELPESIRGPVRALVIRLFPRLQAVFDNTFYDGDAMRAWIAESRVCAPTKFDRYFRFGIDPDELSDREVASFVALGAVAVDVEAAWEEAIATRRRTGKSKAADLITALVVRDNLSSEFCEASMSAFLKVGDSFVANPENRQVGMFEVGPDTLAYRLVHHLVRCLPAERWAGVFLEALRAATAFTVVGYVATSIIEMHRPGAEFRDSVFRDLTAPQVEEVRGIALRLISEAAIDNRLLELPGQTYLLHRWHDWGQAAEVKRWFGAVMQDDGRLVQFLVRSIREGWSHTSGDRTARRTVRMNPSDFRDFLPEGQTLEMLHDRVLMIRQVRQPNDMEVEALNAFQAGMDMIRAGRDPNAPTID